MAPLRLLAAQKVGELSERGAGTQQPGVRHPHRVKLRQGSGARSYSPDKGTNPTWPYGYDLRGLTIQV